MHNKMLEEIDNIKKELKEYIELRIDLIRLHTAENISRLISKTVTILILGYLLMFILLFLSLATGFFIAEKLESNALGFLCVTGFYFLMLVIFLFLRKQIVERPVIKAIVKLFFPKFDDDETR